MKKIALFSFSLLGLVYQSDAQVKIGHNANTAQNPAALLELSNNPQAQPQEWRALILPSVNFDDAIEFVNSTVWGIAGSATEGAVVYNVGTRSSGGFQGKGAYIWTDGAWKPLHAAEARECSDPGPNPGDIGCVNFMYNGKLTTHQTVRAADGKIWLQQNLGSTEVPTNHTNTDAYGDYFQFGRWDDGHQLLTAPLRNVSTLPANNPSGIPNGSNAFFTGDWWNGGGANDTWTALPPSATNGKCPCAALGAGWRLPTPNDWKAVVQAENITGLADVLNSNLKLVASGVRDAQGIRSNINEGIYWANKGAVSGPNARAYSVAFGSKGIYPEESGNTRAIALPIRCIKD